MENLSTTKNKGIGIISLIGALLVLAVFTAYKNNNTISPASCLNDENCLLLKGGTNKTQCGEFSYNNVVFVDNYYDSEGIIDHCEMSPGSSMTFRFKQHNQEYKNHTGNMLVTVTSVSLNDHYALQLLTSNSTKDYADDWDYCGELENYQKGIKTKSITCNGTNVQYIKIINAPWNNNVINYLDHVEVTRQ